MRTQYRTRVLEQDVVLQRGHICRVDCGCPWRTLLCADDRLHPCRRSSLQLCGIEMLEVFHLQWKQSITSLRQCQHSSTSKPLQLCVQTTGKFGAPDCHSSNPCCVCGSASTLTLGAEPHACEPSDACEVLCMQGSPMPHGVLTRVYK